MLWALLVVGAADEAMQRQSVTSSSPKSMVPARSRRERWRARALMLLQELSAAQDEAETAARSSAREGATRILSLTREREAALAERDEAVAHATTAAAELATAVAAAEAASGRATEAEAEAAVQRAAAEGLRQEVAALRADALQLVARLASAPANASSPGRSEWGAEHLEQSVPPQPAPLQPLGDLLASGVLNDASSRARGRAGDTEGGRRRRRSERARAEWLTTADASAGASHTILLREEAGPTAPGLPERDVSELGVSLHELTVSELASLRRMGQKRRSRRAFDTDDVEAVQSPLRAAERLKAVPSALQAEGVDDWVTHRLSVLTPRRPTRPDGHDLDDGAGGDGNDRDETDAEPARGRVVAPPGSGEASPAMDATRAEVVAQQGSRGDLISPVPDSPPAASSPAANSTDQNGGSGPPPRLGGAARDTPQTSPSCPAPGSAARTVRAASTAVGPLRAPPALEDDARPVALPSPAPPPPPQALGSFVPTSFAMLPFATLDTLPSLAEGAGQPNPAGPHLRGAGVGFSPGRPSNAPAPIQALVPLQPSSGGAMLVTPGTGAGMLGLGFFSLSGADGGRAVAIPLVAGFSAFPADAAGTERGLATGAQVLVASPDAAHGAPKPAVATHAEEAEEITRGELGDAGADESADAGPTTDANAVAAPTLAAGLPTSYSLLAAAAVAAADHALARYASDSKTTAADVTPATNSQHAPCGANENVAAVLSRAGSAHEEDGSLPLLQFYPQLYESLLMASSGGQQASLSDWAASPSAAAAAATASGSKPIQVAVGAALSRSHSPGSLHLPVALPLHFALRHRQAPHDQAQSPARPLGAGGGGRRDGAGSSAADAGGTTITHSPAWAAPIIPLLSGLPAGSDTVERRAALEAALAASNQAARAIASMFGTADTAVASSETTPSQSSANTGNSTTRAIALAIPAPGGGFALSQPFLHEGAALHARMTAPTPGGTAGLSPETPGDGATPEGTAARVGASASAPSSFTPMTLQMGEAGIPVALGVLMQHAATPGEPQPAAVPAMISLAAVSSGGTMLRYQPAAATTPIPTVRTALSSPARWMPRHVAQQPQGEPGIMTVAAEPTSAGAEPPQVCAGEPALAGTTGSHFSQSRAALALSPPTPAEAGRIGPQPVSPPQPPTDAGASLRRNENDWPKTRVDCVAQTVASMPQTSPITTAATPRAVAQEDGGDRLPSVPQALAEAGQPDAEALPTPAATETANRAGSSASEARRAALAASAGGKLSSLPWRKAVDAEARQAAKAKAEADGFGEDVGLMRRRLLGGRSRLPARRSGALAAPEPAPVQAEPVESEQVAAPPPGQKSLCRPSQLVPSPLQLAPHSGPAPRHLADENHAVHAAALSPVRTPPSAAAAAALRRFSARGLDSLMTPTRSFSLRAQQNQNQRQRRQQHQHQKVACSPNRSSGLAEPGDGQPGSRDHFSDEDGQDSDARDGTPSPPPPPTDLDPDAEEAASHPDEPQSTVAVATALKTMAAEANAEVGDGLSADADDDADTSRWTTDDEGGRRLETDDMGGDDCDAESSWSDGPDPPPPPLPLPAKTAGVDGPAPPTRAPSPATEPEKAGNHDLVLTAEVPGEPDDEGDSITPRRPPASALGGEGQSSTEAPVPSSGASSGSLHRSLSNLSAQSFAMLPSMAFAVGSAANAAGAGWGYTQHALALASSCSPPRSRMDVVSAAEAELSALEADVRKRRK